MSARLTRLLRPQSIAVAGGDWAAAVIEQCLALGFRGDIWPVNPSREELAGVPCFKSIDALPAAPDACFVGVNHDLTIDLVSALAKFEAGGAVCFASGFRESAWRDNDGSDRQQRLVEAAGGMPIIGPNCYGIINFLDRVALWPDQHGGKAQNDGVAIITQSSNIAINLSMQQRALPVAYLMTAGNQATVSVADMASEVLMDDRVTALGLHIEGFSDIRAFESLARLAREKGKYVVVLKTGITHQSRAALLSHTSSLSGSDKAAGAFLERLGMVRVQGLGEFIETLKVLHGARDVAGYRVLSMSCSGGEAAIVGDVGSSVGLTFPPLHSSQKRALNAVLGKTTTLANPLDYHTTIWDDESAMLSMVQGMLHVGSLPALEPEDPASRLTDPAADVALLVLDFPRADRCAVASWEKAADAFCAAVADWQGTAVVLATLPENMPEAVAESLMEKGVLPLAGLRDGLLALKNAAWLTQVRQQLPAKPVWLTEQDSGTDVGEAIDTLLQLSSIPDGVPDGDSRARRASREAWGLLQPVRNKDQSPRILDESITKRWLSRSGVPIPKSIRLSFADVRSSLRLSRALDKLAPVLSYPVVAKGLGKAHKTDSNALAMNIANRRELERAISRIDCTGGCLVEEQVQGNLIELLVGIVRDPVHGMAITLGAGGVYTELFEDARTGLVPMDRYALKRELNRLRCAPLLEGYRGKQGVNIEDLLDVLLSVQAAALQLGERLIELEINPLICTSDATVAVDALVSVRDI